ncbi:MAG: hypothetical protein EHM90_06985, partial [Chloroflexi bacterium]
MSRRSAGRRQSVRGAAPSGPVRDQPPATDRGMPRRSPPLDPDPNQGRDKAKGPHGPDLGVRVPWGRRPAAGLEGSGRLRLVRERLNWIDWLKVVVVVGAFLFHAAQPFVATTWLINDTEKSLPLSVASGFGYLFGMPLMFFLAGAATWLAVERRGIGGHAGLRLRRLLIPLLLGLVILGPPQAWVAYVAAGGQAGPLEFLATYVTTLNPTLNPRWFGDVGHHLWFLGFLFLYVVVTLPVLSWLRSRRAAGRDLLIGRVAEGRFGLLWLVVPIAAVQLVLRPLFPEYRDWADFALWLGYFVIGIG